MIIVRIIRIHFVNFFKKKLFSFYNIFCYFSILSTYLVVLYYKKFLKLLKKELKEINDYTLFILNLKQKKYKSINAKVYIDSSNLKYLLPLIQETRFISHPIRFKNKSF